MATPIPSHHDAESPLKESSAPRRAPVSDRFEPRGTAGFGLAHLVTPRAPLGRGRVRSIATPRSPGGTPGDRRRAFARFLRSETSSRTRTFFAATAPKGAVHQASASDSSEDDSSFVPAARAGFRPLGTLGFFHCAVRGAVRGSRRGARKDRFLKIGRARARRDDVPRQKSPSQSRRATFAQPWRTPTTARAAAGWRSDPPSPGWRTRRARARLQARSRWPAGAPTRRASPARRRQRRRLFSARALPSRASLSEWDDSALSASAALRSSAPAIARATAARTVGIGPANAFADAFAVPGRECEPRRGGGPQRPPPGDGRVAANATSIAPSDRFEVRAGAGFVLKQALLGRVSSTSSDSDDAEHDDAECSSSSSSAVASVASSAESHASPRRAIPERSSGRLGSYGSKTRGRSAPQAMALTSATSIASSSESEEDTLAASRSFSVAFRGAETSTRFPMESLGPADSQFPDPRCYRSTRPRRTARSRRSPSP